MKNKILSLFSNTVPYIKELRPITGSVTSAILMQQLDYWFAKKPQGFYKYAEPPKGKSNTYKEGDSWTEELGFSAEELKTAYLNIGRAYNSKTEFVKAMEEDRIFFDDNGKEMFYARYYDRGNGNSFYYRNDKLVDSTLEALIRETDNHGLRETDNHGLPMPLETDNHGLRETDNAGLHICTENTSTEITKTENLVVVEPQPFVPLVDLETLTSKKDVLNALMHLAVAAIPVQDYAKTLTSAELEATQKNCTKKHKNKCDCLPHKEIPSFKVLNEAINILNDGAVNWSVETKASKNLVILLRKSKWSLEECIYCLAYAYKKDRLYMRSLNIVTKIIGEFRDKNRTGQLKEELMKETATERNARMTKYIETEEYKEDVERITENLLAGATKKPII